MRAFKLLSDENKMKTVHNINILYIILIHIIYFT